MGKKKEKYKTYKVNAVVIWIVFLLFGWSYGSIDKEYKNELNYNSDGSNSTISGGWLQFMWYALIMINIIDKLTDYSITNFFRSGGAHINFAIGSIFVAIWFIYRLFTLNRDIKDHNRRAARIAGYSEKKIKYMSLL